jgi:hypothetical protein
MPRRFVTIEVGVQDGPHVADPWSNELISGCLVFPSFEIASPGCRSKRNSGDGDYSLGFVLRKAFNL